MTFFVTQDGQSVPASEAAQNYQKLSKAQLGSFIDLEVSVSILGIPPLNMWKMLSSFEWTAKNEKKFQCAVVKTSRLKHVSNIKPIFE